MKILAQILSERLLSSFARFGVIASEQHGFTASALITAQLVDTLYDLYLAPNNGD